MNEEEKEIISEQHFISFKNTRKLLQVSSCTLRNWDKEGKIGTIRTPSGARMFNQQDIFNLIRKTKTNEIVKRKVCYARVSTRAQMDDLERQVFFFKQTYPSYEVVTDICSGINSYNLDSTTCNDLRDNALYVLYLFKIKCKFVVIKNSVIFKAIFHPCIDFSISITS